MDPIKALDKDFKSGWFKRNAQAIVDQIDHLLTDVSFSYSTVRIGLLLLANVH